MTMMLDLNKTGSPLLIEFKRQASFFFKEKIKTARLAFTDVTPTELLTEEVTNGDLWAADTRTMGAISQAAFEVDDYWRIVDILHKRLMKFDRKNWRASYNTLLLLEHLLTHGPLRVAEEFQCDKGVIKEMISFQFVDEKGFNWGLSVTKLSERILELLENGHFLRAKRSSARKLTREIQGFGSFSQQSSSDDHFNIKAFSLLSSTFNSNYGDHHKNDEFEEGSNEKLLFEETIQNAPRFHENTIRHTPGNPSKINGWEYAADDHPFCNNDHQRTTCLLSAVE